ncbi:MAG: hypothetical protein Q8R92_17390, partial [Deltaproteobacteria bacterium]|nr:hypothetical protein [Deltaproteobacteria bacterium]
MNRRTSLLWAAALVLSATSQLQAADLFWQGGTRILTDANYTNTDGTAALSSPLPGDVINFGAGGTATFDGTADFGKLRVGHNQATLSTLNGTGTVTINNGAQLTLTAGASGVGNAAMWVGAANGTAPNGTLNIDNATVTANRLVVVGYGNNVNRTGTVNITNGGKLILLDGNLTLAERTGSSNGVQGYVNMDGATSELSVNQAHLIIGNYGAKAAYNQTNGTATISNQIIVGQRNSDNSSFSISGGAITAGGAMNVSNGTT